MHIKRVAVSTGGGDCPGLNAVIRAFVKTGIGRYGWEIVGIEDGLVGLLEPNKITDLTAASVRGILPRGGTIIGTTNKGNPFSYPVDVDGQVVERDVSDQLVARLEALDIDCLTLIGGDGTMSIAHRLAEKGVNVVGVPKTIDNDLCATDYTFGFDTACTVATEAIDRLHSTAESHDRVMLLELMGRHAGHIALSAGVAGGADVILIPEIPYSIEAVMQKLQRRQRAGITFSIIVVAEGARPRGGDVSLLADAQIGTAARLGGAAHRVAAALSAHDPALEMRVTVLGHLQRGGSPTHMDRVLGTRFGAAAAHLIARQGFGRMVCLRGLDIEDVPITDAIADNRQVSLEEKPGNLVDTARGLGISLGDEAIVL